MLKDKDRRGVASSKIESTFNSSNAVEAVTNGDLKLMTHDLSEKSKTQTKLMKFGLSETIQKREKLVVKKDIIEDYESLKELLSVSPEILNLNVIVSQEEKKKRKILVEKIRSKWNNKNKKFINIHEVVFDTHTLMYAYGKIVN